MIVKNFWLHSTVFLLLFYACPIQNSSAKLDLPKDGHIRFYVYHLDEYLDIRYLDENKNWIDDASHKIQKICRSRGDKKLNPIDKRLVELADHLQDRFQADQIEIISCYRSHEFNKKLKQEGHNVANESLHTKGLAMDIHIDEIQESTLRDYLLKLQLGGVGFYGDRLMVHMDFGPVREWRSGAFIENTKIGIFNEESPIVIRTDKLNYDKGQKIKLRFSHDLKQDLVIEHFSRGKWIATGKIMPQAIVNTTLLKNFGKYRLRFVFGKIWQHSNEFYLKKL